MNELNLFSMAQAAALRSAHVRNPRADAASLVSMQRF